MTKEVYLVTEVFDGYPTTKLYTTKDEQTIAIQKSITSYQDLDFDLIRINPLKENDSFGTAVLRKVTQNVVITWSLQLACFKEDK